MAGSKFETMIDLRDCTFIIPIRIESPDREFNFKFVLQYLCDNLTTNIIIKESDKTNYAEKLLNKIDRKETNIIYLFEESINNIFHRTRLLNDMIYCVRTNITINYDIDIYLEPGIYNIARNKILEGYDLVYPYKNGASLKLVKDKKALEQGNLFSQNCERVNSIAGYCQFFKTSSYIKGGMENVKFVSWGLEDGERRNRFIKLGYKVTWLNNYIYHIEHSRSINSSKNNPHFEQNKKLYQQLRDMPKDDLLKYYSN